MRKWLPWIAALAVAIAFYSVWQSTNSISRTEVTRGSPVPPVSGQRVLTGVTNKLPGIAASNSGPVDTGPIVSAAPPRPAPATSVKVDPLPDDLASVAPETVLENMRTTIRQYGSLFAGNPVGTNPEITQALQGENPKHLNFLKADGNRVNSQGELVDLWGTPYFFHQISGNEMEIRSAGPDHVMYTADDLVIH